MALALCGCVLLAGCIVIPVDYHATGSRHNIELSTTNLLRVGIATREAVLLSLGEPDFVSDDGQRLGYFWTKVKAIWAIASYGSGAGGEITRSYLIETGFDASDRLAFVRVRKQWGDVISGGDDGAVSPQESPRGE